HQRLEFSDEESLAFAFPSCRHRTGPRLLCRTLRPVGNHQCCFPSSRMWKRWLGLVRSRTADLRQVEPTTDLRRGLCAVRHAQARIDRAVSHEAIATEPRRKGPKTRKDEPGMGGLGRSSTGARRSALRATGRSRDLSEDLLRAN